MKRYLLDTNTVSYALRGHSEVLRRMTSKPMASLAISVITEAELLFGLAKRPGAVQLKQVVDEFLRRVDALPLERSFAVTYASIRVRIAQRGITIAPLDLLIAAHAKAIGAILATSDQALIQCDEIECEDWAK